MPIKAAAAVVSLLALAAAPVAFAKGSVTIDGKFLAALQPAKFPATQVALTRQDQMRSCQVPGS